MLAFHFSSNLFLIVEYYSYEIGFITMYMISILQLISNLGLFETETTLSSFKFFEEINSFTTFDFIPNIFGIREL